MDLAKEHPMAKARPSDVFFLSCARTLSNLLVKLLSKQDGWEECGYHLHGAYLYGLQHFSTSVDAKAEPEDRQEYVKQLREGYAKMLAAREAAYANGNSIFLKSHICQIWEPSPIFEATRHGEFASEFSLSENDHSSTSTPRTNPTMVPDDFLTSFVPLFLIRHPALMIDSWYRTEARVGMAPDIRLRTRELSQGLGIARILYDWYADRIAGTGTSLAPGDAGYPIIVDADDILEGDTVRRLTETIGMDPAQVLSRWETRSTEGMVPIDKSYVEGIRQSTGIDTSKSAKFLDLEAKYRSWHELYGDEVGDYLVNLAEENLVDYNYLKAKKM